MKSIMLMMATALAMSAAQGQMPEMDEAPRSFLQDRGYGKRGSKWNFFKGKNG